MTTLVKNMKGQYEAMFISPKEVREHLINQYAPDTWQLLGTQIDSRAEIWIHKPTNIQIVFAVDTSSPLNQVHIDATLNNVKLVSSYFTGLDAIAYANIIGEFIQSGKDA